MTRPVESFDYFDFAAENARAQAHAILTDNPAALDDPPCPRCGGRLLRGDHLTICAACDHRIEAGQ